MACAFLTLVDKGKVKLSDPISKYIPFSEAGPRSFETFLPSPNHVVFFSFFNCQVKAVKAAKSKSKAVENVPTLRNLLTMTAGLQYQD